MCVSGQANAQRGLWKKSKKKAASSDDGSADTGGHTVDSTRPTWMKKKFHDDSSAPLNWMEVSSPNNLADVHHLYAKNSKIKLNKDVREVFVQGSLKDVREDFQVR